METIVTLFQNDSLIEDGVEIKVLPFHEFHHSSILA